MQTRLSAALVAVLFCLPSGACRKKRPPAPSAAAPAVVPAPPPEPEPAAARLDLAASPAPPVSGLGPSEQEVSELRENVARSHSRPRPLEGSPESFAESMKGKIACGNRQCRAGSEICVASPSEDHPARCARIVRWIDHHTPVPQAGFPPLAGITMCEGSDNCPAASVCCLHMLGLAEVQVTACHASLEECEHERELCSGRRASECRTSGTRCRSGECVVEGDDG